MMISGDMPHAEARDNSITEIKERNDISEIQRKRFSARMPKGFFISKGEAEWSFLLT